MGRMNGLPSMLDDPDVEHGLSAHEVAKIGNAVSYKRFSPSFRNGETTKFHHSWVVRIQRKIVPPLHYRSSVCIVINVTSIENPQPMVTDGRQVESCADSGAIRHLLQPRWFSTTTP